MILKLATLILCGFGLLMLLSCTGIAIKDNEFIADAGKAGAYAFHSLSDKQRDLTKEQWDKERFGMICETTDVFTNLKEAIEALCQTTNACTYEQQQMVSEFYSKVQKTAKKASKK